MAETLTPEAAVRDYLTFLNDPESLVDPEEVSRLEGEIAKTTDPVERLMVMARLHKARSADPDAYEKAFVSQAKIWADAEDIPATAFEEMGVSVDVLRAAKLLPGGRRGIMTIRAKALSAARKPGVKSTELEAGILLMPEPFTVKDVSERVGGSTVTVKAAIDRLEAQGKITAAGERTGQRGRAAKTWTVS